MALARKVSLPLLAVLFSGAVAHGEAPPDKWYAELSCTRASDVGAYKLPATLTKETVLRDLLGTAPKGSDAEEVELTCSVFGQPWKSQKDPMFIAFVQTAVYHKAEPSDEEYKVRVGVYRQETSGAYGLVARTAAPLSLGRSTVISPDFARYKLTPTEYAFGVRSWMEAFNAHGGNEHLHLFRVQGTVVEPILSILMMSRWEKGVTLEDGEAGIDSDGIDETATISVLKTRTRGIFDWKLELNGKFNRLKWNGARYELKGDPIVEDVNTAR